MGSNWSKLKRAVERGDEAKALEIINKSPDIRRKLNANAVVNEYSLDTYMHVCAKYGMVDLLKILLYENNGNPNKTNRHRQTVLHKVCQGQVDSVQYECMKLLLQWHDTSENASHLIAKATVPNSTGSLSTRGGGDAADINDLNRISRHQENLASLIDINVNAKDEHDNTPLHYAAMKNLPNCVQTLVAHGAYLFIENFEHYTPCDLAERQGNKDIALYLESKMIFSKDEDEKDLDEQEVVLIEEKETVGLRIQDLQEEKDKLLIETAEALHCDVFTAEILLKKHAWSKEDLLSAWVEDPIKCCEKCGITVEAIKTTTSPVNSASFAPTSTKSKIKPLELDSSQIVARRLSGRYINKRRNQNTGGSKSPSELTRSSNKFADKSSTGDNEMVSDEKSAIKKDENKDDSMSCGICFAGFDSTHPVLDLTRLRQRKENSKKCELDQEEENVEHENQLVDVICGHRFCRECWERYLTMKIEEGNVVDIVCPQTDCYIIVAPDLVGRLVSKETVSKYLQFDLKAFVDSNPSYKWCPFPGCGRAVRDPKLAIVTNNVTESEANEDVADNLINGISMDMININLRAGLNQNGDNSEYSKSVDCGAGHYFCWDCLEEGHAPASCNNWKDWYEKIKQVKPEELYNTNEKEEISANYLWLVTNSKLCPNQHCRAPIQKNEGCNHIKCSKCKHDFCWICMEPWKKHSSATGGYFQCNRYEVSNKVSQKEKDSIAYAEEMHIKAAELNKFVHYYTRFKNHENSCKIEEPLLKMAKTKFEILIATNNSIGDAASPPKPGEAQYSLDDTATVGEASHSQKQFMRHSSFSLAHSSTAASPSSSPSNRRLNNFDTDNDSKVLTMTRKSWMLSKENIIPEEEKQPLRDVGSKQDLVRQDTEENKSGDDTNSEDKKARSDEPHYFIEEAIRELLRARRILRCSYVYGYYLDTFGHKKFIFELIQTEFEECTENLSQVIARPHLKTPKNKIIRLTNMLKRKRVEFLDTITRGLNSFNDTPPTLKKYSRQRWKYLLKDNIQNEDEFKNTIALSIRGELNPKNPWIVDKKGRHTNLLALLNDWPELETELESILAPSKEKKGLCAKWDCGNVRAVNTLSGALCNYCSIKCMKMDHNAYLDQKKKTEQQQQQQQQQQQVQRKVSSATRSEEESKKSTDSPSMSLQQPDSDEKKVNSYYDEFFDMGFSDLVENYRLMKPSGRIKNSSFADQIESARPAQITSNNRSMNNARPSDLDMSFGSNGAESALNIPAGSHERKSSQVSHLTHASNATSSTSSSVNSASCNNFISVSSLPYEPLYVTANEEDISVILKNIKNVIFDESSRGASGGETAGSSGGGGGGYMDKTHKVCNFQLKKQI